MKMLEIIVYKKLNLLDFCLDNGGSFFVLFKFFFCFESFKYVVCVFFYRKEILVYYIFCIV